MANENAKENTEQDKRLKKIDILDQHMMGGIEDNRRRSLQNVQPITEQEKQLKLEIKNRIAGDKNTLSKSKKCTDKKIRKAQDHGDGVVTGKTRSKDGGLNLRWE